MFECRAEDLLEERELGRGAYGCVYQMRHTVTDTLMAVKVCVCVLEFTCHTLLPHHNPITPHANVHLHADMHVPAHI